MDQFLTKKTIEKANQILSNEAIRNQMVEQNYELALNHFSYRFLWKNLSFLLTRFFGLDHI